MLRPKGGCPHDSPADVPPEYRRLASFPGFQTFVLAQREAHLPTAPSSMRSDSANDFCTARYRTSVAARCGVKVPTATTSNFRIRTGPASPPFEHRRRSG